jgi:hypothetical protein
MSKLSDKLAFAALGAVTTYATQRALQAAWTALTGEEPPDPSDPETPAVVAITWAVASGVGLGVAQLLVNRYGQKKFGAKAKRVQIEL